MSPRNKIINMGLLSFALSATAVNAAKIKWVKIDGIGRISDNTFTQNVEIRNERDEEGTFTICLKPTIQGLENVGLLDIPHDPGWTQLNPYDADEYTLTDLSNHVSDNNGNCHVSDHFSVGDNQGCLLELPTLFSHKNSLVMENEDSSVLVAKHFHDVSSAEGDIACHVSNHWSQGDGLCGGSKTNHVNTSTDAGWIDEDGWEKC